MNREEFMAKLKALLGDIPADEREEALQYYEDYFDRKIQVTFSIQRNWKIVLCNIVRYSSATPRTR